jgi:hypothetical protein
MKRLSTLVAAAVAVSLGAVAYGAQQQSRTPAGAEPAAEQPTTSDQMPTQEQAVTPAAAQPDTATASGATTTTQPATRLAAMVPSGMTTQEACGGFKSLDECAATLHAAQNLGIPFSELKSRVTGGQKLGAAIHSLKPDASAREEVRKAEEQARSDTRSPQG